MVIPSLIAFQSNSGDVCIMVSTNFHPRKCMYFYAGTGVFSLEVPPLEGCCYTRMCILFAWDIFSVNKQQTQGAQRCREQIPIYITYLEVL
jgi:hypothetical protein